MVIVTTRRVQRRAPGPFAPQRGLSRWPARAQRAIQRNQNLARRSTGGSLRAHLRTHATIRAENKQAL